MRLKNINAQFIKKNPKINRLLPESTDDDAAFAKKLANKWAEEEDAAIQHDAEMAKNLAKKWAEEQAIHADYLLAQKLQNEENIAYFIEEQKKADAAAALEESTTAERKQQATAEVHRERTAARARTIAAQQQAPAAPSNNNAAEPVAPILPLPAEDDADPAVANQTKRPAAKPLSRTTQHVLDNKTQYADAFNGLSDAELTKLLEENNPSVLTMTEVFNSESGSIGLILQSINEDFKNDGKIRAMIMHHLLNSSKEVFENFFQTQMTNQKLQDNKAGLLAIHEMVQHAKRPIMLYYPSDNNIILNRVVLKNRSSDAKFNALSLQEKAKILQQEVNAFANVLNTSLDSNFKAAVNQLQPADQEALKKELTAARENHSETTQAVLQNKDDYKIFKHLTESELVSLLDKNNLPVVTLQGLYAEYGAITSVMEALDDLTPATKADILYRLLNSSERDFKKFLANNAGNNAIQSNKDSLLQLHKYITHSAIPAKISSIHQRDQYNNLHEVGQGLDLRNEVTQLIKREFKEADVANAYYSDANFADKQKRLQEQLPAINQQQAKFHNILTATLNSHYQAAVKALPTAEQRRFNQAHPLQQPQQQRTTPNQSSPATLRGPHAMFPAPRRHQEQPENELENFFAILQGRSPINRRDDAVDLLETLLTALRPQRNPIEDDILLMMNVVGLHAFRQLSPNPFRVFLNFEDEQPLRQFIVRIG